MKIGKDFQMMKTNPALGEAIKYDLIKVGIVLILAFWLVLSVVPWINMAYGETALWISTCFALTGAIVFIPIYPISMILSASGARECVQAGWKKAMPGIAVYAVVWILAFSFWG